MYLIKKGKYLFKHMIQYEYITNSNFADNQCIIFELKFSRLCLMAVREPSKRRSKVFGKKL